MGSYCGSFQPVFPPQSGTPGTRSARCAEGGRGVHVVPVASSQDEAEVLRRARKVAGGKPVIIVTEADGKLSARLR